MENKTSITEKTKALNIADVSSRLSFEEMVWKKRFPDEDFDADNFYDWAAENGKEPHINHKVELV